MSDFTEKVWAMLDAATPGPWKSNPGGCCERIVGQGGFRVIDSDGFRYSDGNVRGNVDFIAAAPTLLREACERIEALEKVAESAKEWDTAYSLSGKFNAAVRLRNALSALDAADTGEK